MSSTLLDVVLAVAFIGYGLLGFRQGLITGAMSLLGFVGGAVIAMLTLPAVAERIDPGLGRVALLLLGVLACAFLGQAVAVFIGLSLRSAITWKPAQTVDAALGAVAGLVTIALIVWFVAAAVRGGPTPSLSRAVANSLFVSSIDDVVPESANELFSEFRSAVESGDYPRVFAGLQPERIAKIDPPAEGVAAGPGVVAAAAGVVKVTGMAPPCQQGQEGSGFVVAPGRVVTNAHVVAGVVDPQVQVGGQGEQYLGTVVLFDPDRDLAVIDVPDLPTAPLVIGRELARGADTVVAGYPRNGPYAVGAARVREEITARGEDIYGAAGVDRQVYSLFATVAPGNSGGPLLDPAGAVVGVIFATSLDDPQTGYALTLDELIPVLDASRFLSGPVSTGGCA